MNSEVNNVTNNVEIVDNEKKNGKNIILIVIALLVVVLCGLLAFKYFQKKTETSNIYYETIDKFSNSLVEGLDTLNTEFKSLFGSSVNLSINMKSNDNTLKDIVKIVNNLKVKMDLETNPNKKMMYTDLDFQYNNNSLVSGELLLKDNVLYGNIPDLYNRPIKLYALNQDLDSLENIKSDDIKVIVTEFASILKSSLKEEWFTLTEEEIEVTGKNVPVYNHTLILDGEKNYELGSNLIDGILNNTKLLNALANVSEISVDDIKEKLTEAKEDMIKDDETFESHIYINKSNNQVEQVTFKVNVEDQEDTLELIKTEKNNKEVFNILVNQEKLGDIYFDDKQVTLNINYEDNNCLIDIKQDKNENNVILNVENSDIKMEINLKSLEKNGTAVIHIVSETDDVDLTLNMDYVTKELNNIKTFTTSNYIDVNSIKDEDLYTMLEKLQTNKAFTDLMNDVNSVNAGL